MIATSLIVHAQRQLDVQGTQNSTDTVVTIRVNFTSNDPDPDVIGLAVCSDHGSGQGDGIASFGGRTGVFRKTSRGVGVRGHSSTGPGMFASSTSGFGIDASSSTNYAIQGWSFNSTGARIRGGGGIAIELGGADSAWGSGNDDSVIRTDPSHSSGDMILVTNDALSVHLDDDNNSTSSLQIFNGVNTQIFTLTEAGNLTLTGSCSCSSDAKRKENFNAIDNQDILDKIAALPISEWQFIGEHVRHIGPMAQDFYAAFHLGDSDTAIATVDADGVALAAIQALKKENDTLRTLVEDLAKRLEKLDGR